jgi:Ca2+-binding RTX toxin-like protein
MSGHGEYSKRTGGYSSSTILDGGPGADRVIEVGSAEGAVLGGSGSDMVVANGHNDFASGGPGIDTLTLAGDGDTAIGVTGDGDRVRLHGPDYIVLLGQNALGPLDIDLTAGTVRLVGAATGDVITYDAGPTKPPYIVVYGTHGNDRISGRDDNGNALDMMFGLAGNDVLSGRGGDDSLDGGLGDDALDGGDGRDQAYGGKGSDTCTNADVEGCSP